MKLAEIFSGQFPGRQVWCVACSNSGKKRCLKNGVLCGSYEPKLKNEGPKYYDGAIRGNFKFQQP